MILKEPPQQIEEITKEFFLKMEADGTVTVSSQDDGSVSVNFHMEDPQLLIGERGQTLAEIQHLLRLIIRKRLQEQIPLFLDINEYRKSKERYIREIARSAADEAVLLRRPKELPVMSAPERRIAHLAISERTDVTSESVGEEPERRVVIKPKPQDIGF